jgi:molybdate transport system substrate-binding protein
MRRAVLAAAVALAATLTLPAATSAGRSGSGITVFAAASLTGVFPKIASVPRYSFAGSDQLAFQLRQGAQADVYAAASPKYPELLYRDGLVRKPIVFATNALVLIVPKSNPGRLRSVYDLRRDGVKLVIGGPTVPIGTYTRQILDTLGITDDVLKNVVSQETDVKGIVAKVALGEADAGFVYATDAKAAAARTKTLALPVWAQPPIRYEIAVVSFTKRPAAGRAFVAKVLSKRGRALLSRAGFGVPKRK